MPFKKGEPRSPNAGRKKGTPNKEVTPLIQKAAELGVDPFEILLMFAKEDWQGLGYEAKSKICYTNAGIEFEQLVIEPAMRLKAAAEACQYIYPKRKAIEATIDPALIEAFKALEGKTEEELLAIIQVKK